MRSLPEQAQELTQGELEGDQELCFVQEGESLFTRVTFNNHLNTKNTQGISLQLTQHQEHWRSNASCLTGKKQLTGNLLGNLDRMLHTSSFLVSRKTNEGNTFKNQRPHICSADADAGADQRIA